VISRLYFNTHPSSLIAARVVLAQLLVVNVFFNQCLGQGFKITDSKGQPLVLATIINLRLNNIIRADSNGFVVCSPLDSFQIRHVGYETVRLSHPIPEIVMLKSKDYNFNSVVITDEEILPEYLGVRLSKKDKKNTLFFGGIIEWGIEIENVTSKDVLVTNACFSIDNSELVPGLIDRYHPFQVTAYNKIGDENDQIVTKSLLADSVYVVNERKGECYVCKDISAAKIVLRSKSKLVLCLKSYWLSGGEYDTKLKRDVTLDRNRTYSNIVLWGSRVNFKKVKDNSYYFIRSETLGNKWFRHQSRIIPAFYITYSVVTD
jgi:hypothetical protein